jgi:hypothetical protein
MNNNQWIDVKINWDDTDKLAKDCWLFLTDDSMPEKKIINKKAFLHEISAMLELVKNHFQSEPPKPQQ